MNNSSTFLIRSSKRTTVTFHVFWIFSQISLLGVSATLHIAQVHVRRAESLLSYLGIYFICICGRNCMDAFAQHVYSSGATAMLSINNKYELHLVRYFNEMEYLSDNYSAKKKKNKTKIKMRKIKEIFSWSFFLYRWQFWNDSVEYLFWLRLLCSKLTNNY